MLSGSFIGMEGASALDWDRAGLRGERKRGGFGRPGPLSTPSSRRPGRRRLRLRGRGGGGRRR